MSELDVFIGNRTFIDLDIFQLWSDGYSVEEATSICHQREPDAPLDLLTSEVSDQFRAYGLLERLLQKPRLFKEQWTFQIVPEIQHQIISKYYGLDDLVARELLGKKLSSKQRKDLDEVCEKTGISLRSCRRQFDNIKRIYKTIEESGDSAVRTIKANYLLPDELSRKYASIVFITSNRFETRKRKLQFLTLTDFHRCACAIMSQWSTFSAVAPDKSPDVLRRDQAEDMEVDKDFLNQLKDLRLLHDREKEHKHLVCHRMKPLVLEQTHRELENNFKSYSRTLLTIASSLYHAKDLRDLFLDLVEKFIEPCRHLHWTHSDLKSFLDVYTKSALELDILRESAELKLAWEKYMTVVSACILQMFHS